MGNEEKQGYSASELVEFEELINIKLEKAKTELHNLKSALSKDGENGTDASSAR